MALFGRHLGGKADVLSGFKETAFVIEDPTTVALSGKTQHTIAKFTGRDSDSVAGTVFALTLEEIEKADGYEVAPYERMEVVLESGVRAWVYVDGSGSQ